MCVVALAILSLMAAGLAPAAAAPSTKKYTATVSPTSVSAGQASVLTFRIRNSSASVQEVGSANLSIPSGWTASLCTPVAPCAGVTQDPSNLRTSGTPSRRWTAAIVGGVIKLRNPGPTSMNRLRPNEYVEVAVSATPPCAEGAATWNVAAKQSNDFSGAGNDFTLVGSAPTVTVTGACGGGLDHFSVSAPASTVAGEGFPLTIVARDASNEPVTGYTGTVHFSSSDPNADLPSDTAFVATDAGSRAFSGVTLRTSGGQSVTVQDTLITSATGSATVAVGADPAVAELDVQASTTQITAGGSVTFTASGSDRYGNPLGDVTSSTAFEMSEGECVLNTCSSTVASEQVVTATNGTAQSETQIQVDPGPLDRIRVTPSAATITAGEEQDYTVRGFDEFGNPRGELTADASLSIGPDGTCSAGSCGSTTSGPHLVTAIVGTFSDTADLQVEPALADHLAISSQPTKTALSDIITPAVTVRILDRFDNLVTDSNAPVTMEIGPGAPDNGTLSGGGPTMPSGGVATFDTLAIDRSGVGYTLVASSPGLASATSDPFEISDSLQNCQQQGGCTATVIDATTSATVTVPSYDGVGGVDGVLSVTLDPQNDGACAESRSPKGSAIWVDPPDGSSFAAPIRIDLTIDKSEAPGTGVANFIFCKDEGPGTSSESLPDCRNKHPNPPCVLKRSRSGVGDLLATILILPFDPRLGTR